MVRGNRKTRTTITKEKLDKINQIFKDYLASKSSKNGPIDINLREIARDLELGYSTVLHKLKEFKDNKEVKGGFLLELGDSKRKYKKSVEVERYIR